MIKAEALTKTYGNLTAVDNLSFRVEPGVVLGFLGPNGAGKTTTMRMIAGFVEPTSGRAEICGFPLDTRPTEAKACLGYLPEGAPSYGEMTPRSFLEFIASVRGLKGGDRQRRLDDTIERLQLGSVLNQQIETLSKGFKRRVGIAQAILHDPAVLILDEPTDGLDPNQKHEVRNLIKSMSEEKIIVISTHILEEVDAVCNRAIIIANGRIVADETPEALLQRSKYHNAVTIEFDQDFDIHLAEQAIGQLPQVGSVATDPATHSLTAFPRSGKRIFGAISAKAADQGWRIEQLHLESGRMDEVFRTITMGDRAS